MRVADTDPRKAQGLPDGFDRLHDQLRGLNGAGQVPRPERGSPHIHGRTVHLPVPVQRQFHVNQPALGFD